METLPAKPEVALDGPLAESFDMRGCCCPACNCPRAEIRNDGDVKIGYCPECSCEFTPQVESISRQVIRRISERRARQRSRFSEALPRVMPGINRLDYDLFKKIVDGAPEDEDAADSAGIDLPPEA